MFGTALMQDWTIKMKNDVRWKKTILSGEFVSESCAIFGYDISSNPIIIAGEYLWYKDGKKERIREINDAWLPPWPHKDRIDISPATYVPSPMSSNPIDPDMLNAVQQKLARRKSN